MKNKHKFKEKFPAKCPYLNLYAEILRQNAGHFDTYCKYARVTHNLMVGILNGNGDFTNEEKRNLINVYWNTGININCSYLFNNKLSFYDLKKSKHYRKFQLIYNKLEMLIKNPIVQMNFMYKHDYVEFNEYIKQRYVLRADYNKLVYLLNFFELITRKPKIRSR